jgi:hypothetical protein
VCCRVWLGLVQRHLEAKYPDPDLKAIFTDPQLCCLPGVVAFGQDWYSATWRPNIRIRIWKKYLRIHNTAVYPVLPRFVRAGTAPRGGQTHGPRPQLSDLRPELLTPGQVQDTPQEQAWRAAVDSHTFQARAEAPKEVPVPPFLLPCHSPLA